MFDLKQILMSKEIQIYEFFGRSDEERKCKFNRFCNIECMINNLNIPTFSEFQF